MIRFGKTGLELSPAVARALLTSTEQDSNRPHLSVGIDKGDVCATDGKTLVRFQRAEVDPDGLSVEAKNGCYWPLGYVEGQCEAGGRKGPVLLEWSAMMTGGFPPVHKVEPPAGVAPLRAPIGFDACLMARLELVAKACRREREPGDKELPPVPGVVLTSLMNELDPMRFTVGAEEFQGHLRAAHTAFFTIMPMRIGYSTVRPKAAKKPRAKKARAA